MSNTAKYLVGQKVRIVKDDSGWYHGVGDGREVRIHRVTPLPEIRTYEYEVMDENTDFYHIPENDLA